MRRQLLTGLRVTVCLLVLLTGIYPLVVWGIGRVAFRHQADGSFVSAGGNVVGSALIGQTWNDRDGKPLPQYFQPRPSAAGSGYDPSASSASNLGPSNPKLIGLCNPVPATDAAGNPQLDAGGKPVNELNPDGTPVCDPGSVPQRVIAYRRFNGLSPDAPVPVDAVTASGSGLDPDISVANARAQTARVAQARKISVEQVQALVRAHTSERTWGFLGEKTVNVLHLNLALDAAKAG